MTESVHPSTSGSQTQLIGRSPEIVAVQQLATRAAQARSPVLLTGETGTGKEVLARLIHARSRRAARPFVAVNCAALPEALVESELFGHERGAFTGAVRTSPGLFEEAHGGTLFLDEVAELPCSAQTKLLRVLQESRARRVGSNAERTVDVRVLAATNRPLQQALAEGALRQDLYYRLCVVELHLPALRDRREDLPVLAQHFLDRYASQNSSTLRHVSGAALDVFDSYDWPGNVRELENVIERATVLAPPEDGELLLPKHLPPGIEGHIGDMPGPTVPDESLHLEAAMQRLRIRYATEALRRTNGSRAQAARLLRMSRRGLYYLLEQAGLEETRWAADCTPSDAISVKEIARPA